MYHEPKTAGRHLGPLASRLHFIVRMAAGGGVIEDEFTPKERKPMSTSDERLFFAYLERPHRRRLAALVSAYHALVWQVAWRATGHADDAEDVTQDVFLRLLLDPPRSKDVRSPAGYLAWRAVQRASNTRRARERRLRRECRGLERLAGEGLAAEDVEAVREAIAALPEELRTAVELRYFGGLSQREMARALGISQSAVEKRLRRARDILASRLRDSVFPSVLLLLESGRADRAPPVDHVLRLGRVLRQGRALGRVRGAPSPARGAQAQATRPPARSALLATAGVALLVLAGRFALIDPPEDPPEERARVAAPKALPDAARPAVSATPDGHGAPAGEAGAGDADPQPPSPVRAALSGRVWDDEEHLLAGARVTLRVDLDAAAVEALAEEGYSELTPGTVERTTLTDDAGEYRLEGLLPLRQEARVEKGDLLMGGPAAAVEFEPGEEQEKSFTLRHPVRVLGAVRSSRGEPVPGAELRFEYDGAKHLGDLEVLEERVFFSDDRGRYDVGPGLMLDLDHDFLQCLVRAPGHAAQAVAFRREEFTDHVARKDIVLEPGARLRVRVVDPRGTPVEGATVRRGVPGWPARLGGTTDADGVFVFENLKEEPESFSVSANGFFTGSERFDPRESESATVSLRRHGPPIRATIRFDAALRVSEEKQQRAPDLQRQGTDGRFGNYREFAASPHHETGEYRLFPEGLGVFRLRFQLGLIGFCSEVFFYDGRSAVEIDLPVTVRPPYVRGTVRRPGDGSPVAGAPVVARFLVPGSEHRSTWSGYTTVNRFRLYDRPGNATGVTTGEEGRFLLLLPREEFDFWRADQSQVVLSVGSEEIGWSEDLLLEFGPDSVVEDATLTLLETGGIDGRVLGADGLPSQGEVVVASNAAGRHKTVQTDREGRYHIDRLPVGRYFVKALGRGGIPETGGGLGGGPGDDVQPPHEFFPRPVEVVADRVTRWDIDLGRDALGAIEATVEPRPGSRSRIHVLCALVAGGPPGSTPGAFSRRAGVSSGAVRFEGLLAGTYRVWLEKRREVLAESQAVVRPGETGRVALSLPAAHGE